MAETQISILLKLVDEASEEIKKVNTVIRKNVEASAKSLREFSEDFKRLGKTISQVGSTLTAFGAGITGPFLIALRNAAKESIGLNNSLRAIDSVFRELSVTIASSLAPIVNNFAVLLQRLLAWFNSLDPVLRNTIVQTTFLTGVLLSISGIVTLLTGKIIILIANISKLASSLLMFALANPVLTALTIALVSFGVVLLRNREFANMVLNAFQTLFLSLQQGFFEARAAITGFVSSGLESLAQLYEFLQKLPGPLKGFYQEAQIAALGASNSLRQMANEDLVNAKIKAIELEQIFTTGTGSWGEGFDRVRDKVNGLVGAIKNIGSTSTGVVAQAKLSFNQLLNGATETLSTLSSALEGAAAQNKAFAKAAGVVALSLAIINTAAGGTRAFKDYSWPFSLLVGGIIAAAGAIQIATIAAQKFHEGGMVGSGLQSGEVPIIAQTGEGILSRKGMAAVGGEGALNRLNSGNSLTTGNIYVEVNYPRVQNDTDIKGLARMLGFEIQSQLRQARGI